MAEILLFHHARGLTAGIAGFADELRSAGHRVTVPDLFAGHTFPTIEDGLAYAESVGFASIVAAGAAAAEDLPREIVYAGFSLGAMPAQMLAQQRAGARGALLYHGGVPVGEFGEAWPRGVSVQAHVMRDDRWAEPDIPALEDLVGQAGGDLYFYDGDAHLFTDSSIDEYDPQAAALVMHRTLEFLECLP